jgi:hypothetical protein
MNKAETIEMMRGFMASDSVQEQDRRCLYENDDIVVVNNFINLSESTREASIGFYTKKDGQLLRSETGATKLNA